MNIDDALELIANYELCRELEQNIEELPGFKDYYHQIQPLRDRQLLRRWEQHRAEARADLQNIKNDNES